ncbi:hypothetical protein, partial [Actinoplanes subtropicus]|uniref:hypothetical protein n=1 Tax=Actinoplanes subtropicus TaxID=543632 RepID=UPI000556389C
MVTSSVSHTPRQWETSTSALLVLGSVVAVLHVVAAVMLVTSGTSWATAGSWATADRMAVVALLLAELGWQRWTKRILRSFGDDASGLGRHWAFQLAGVLLAVDIVISGSDRAVLLSSALWATALAAGLFGLVKVRDVVRGVVSGQIEPYAEDPELLPPIVSDPPVRYEAPPGAAASAPADDGFWAAVSEAARAPGGAALLETTPVLSRRWLALPADGDVTATRASVPAGAALTLWPAAPDLRAKPPVAPEYYGLLQATSGGPIQFRLVLPSRVAAFTTEARTAHRAGLYLPTDRAART